MGLFKRILSGRQDEESYTDYPDELEEEHYGLGASMERPQYGSKELDFFTYISSSQLLPGIIELIESRPLTKNFKMRLVKATVQLLSVEELLANNNPQKAGLAVTNVLKINSNEADIILWSTVLGATAHDLQAFDAFSYFKIIKKTYKAMQTRTIGPKRERVILTELKSTFTNINESVRKELDPMQHQPRKKGMFNFF